MPLAGGRKMLFLRIFGCNVQIDCRDAEAYELLVANYGQMQSPKSAFPKLTYTISRPSKTSSFSITGGRSEPLTASDDGEFLFLFEKELTIQLEKWRHDLYFLHAGALGFSRGAFLLVASSGKGKSTTTWALLHHGFRYLSDELAALRLDTLQVHPYPHAICLKQNPPSPYFLPDRAVATSSTVHIPVAQLPSGPISKPMPLSAIFFLEYRLGRNPPTIRRVSHGESAARLFANALNPLAHPQNGLAGAAMIAQNVASFCLTSGELGLTCELIAKTLESTAAEHGLPFKTA